LEHYRTIASSSRSLGSPTRWRPARCGAPGDEQCAPTAGAGRGRSSTLPSRSSLRPIGRCRPSRSTLQSRPCSACPSAGVRSSRPWPAISRASVADPASSEWGEGSIAVWVSERCKGSLLASTRSRRTTFEHRVRHRW